MPSQESLTLSGAREPRSRTGARRLCIRPRVETQSGPPDDGGGDGDSRGEVPRELVVTRGDASPIFDPAVSALDEIPQLVSLGIKRMEVFSRRVVWNHRKGASTGEELSQRVAIIGHVGDTQARRR
jgi:hypothetical protein